MKPHVLLLSIASLFASASALADAPTKGGERSEAPGGATSAPGTKGTLYGELPLGTVSDEYSGHGTPKSLSPMPAHLRIKHADGLTYLSDRSNPDGFNPRAPLLSCLSDRGSLQAASVINAETGMSRSVQSVRLEETASGATLLTDSILLRSGQPTGAFHHGSLPLKKLQTVAGGLVIYGGREDHDSKHYVHFVVKPPALEDARASMFQHANVQSTNGHFTNSNGCGFLFVSLQIAKDVANTTLVRMNTMLSASDIEVPPAPEEPNMPTKGVRVAQPRVNNQKDVVLRPIGIAFSASQLGGDPEPRVAISAAWKGDETTQRVFIEPRKAPPARFVD